MKVAGGRTWDSLQSILAGVISLEYEVNHGNIINITMLLIVWELTEEKYERKFRGSSQWYWANKVSLHRKVPEVLTEM
jgi:hypothetical protein